MDCYFAYYGGFQMLDLKNLADFQNISFFAVLVKSEPQQNFNNLVKSRYLPEVITYILRTKLSWN